MRILLLITFIFLTNPLIGQEITGTYNGDYGCTIEIRSDSTFKFKWNFDLAGSWSIGTWKLNKNKMTLNTTPVYDTLQRTDKQDSLVLSMDEHSNRMTNEVFLTGLISGIGQGRHEPPKELIYKNNKLYQVDDRGKPSKIKGRTIYNKKYNSWYTRIE